MLMLQTPEDWKQMERIKYVQKTLASGDSLEMKTSQVRLSYVRELVICT